MSIISAGGAVVGAGGLLLVATRSSAVCGLTLLTLRI
jgi:hypothetical protein